MRNVILLIYACLLGCYACTRTNIQTTKWEEIGYIDSSNVKHGIPAYGGTNVDYKRNGKLMLKVRMKEPSVIDVAIKPEEWGFFQFPNIYRSIDNELIARWSMAADAIDSYGKGLYGYAVSLNDGKTWNLAGGSPPVGGGLLLPNGDRIQVHIAKALKVDELNLPKPIAANRESYGLYYTYYRINQLPEVFHGVYFSRLVKGESTWNIEHAVVDDSLAIQNTDSGLIPVVWFGDMDIASDGSIIASFYPGFYLNEEGEIAPCGAVFYRSIDAGHTWKVQGKIPYQPDLKTDPDGDKRLVMGFTEPGFEILANGTFLCVLRTTDGMGNGPMYVSRSTDSGITWTKPETFTKAGVFPRVLQLGNGVIVLSSGRPGVQLRFCTDGKGEKWTDPFEMLPFKSEKETVSCGYTDLIVTGPDSFLVIYSDFKYKNKDGEIRKAIKVREVKVTPQKIMN